MIVKCENKLEKQDADSLWQPAFYMSVFLIKASAPGYPEADLTFKNPLRVEQSYPL